MNKNRSSAFLFVLLIGMAASAVLAAAASAHSGRLDPSYGDGGIARTADGTAGYEPDVELTMDGAKAFVGDGPTGTAALFAPDGTIDHSFGRHGRFAISSEGQLLEIGGRRFYPSSITIDRRGRVVAFGAAVAPDVEATGPDGVVSSSSLAAVTRFGPHGSLDHSFGAGRGYSIGRFGVAPYPAGEVPRISASAGVVDSRDRPLFVVSSVGFVGGCEGHGTEEPVPRGLVRLAPSGSRDGAFGVRGFVSIQGGGGSPVLDLDGRDRPGVDVGNFGTYAADCGEGSILYRFGSDGRAADGFGTEGKTLKSMHLLAIQPSGAAVLAEDRGPTVEIARLRPDGSRERLFGHRGIAVVHLPHGVDSYVSSAAVDGRGRILLVGASDPGGPGKAGRSATGAILVGRLLPDGRPDRSFGRNGWLLSRLPGHLRLTDTDAALDGNGRLLVGGFADDRPSVDSNGAFVVARYLLGP